VSTADNGAVVYFGLANAIRWKAPEKAPRSPNISFENVLLLCSSSRHFSVIEPVKQDYLQQYAIVKLLQMSICLRR
jgi:hypothetical protein